MLKIISEIKDFLKENNCRMNYGGGIHMYIPPSYGILPQFHLGVSIYTDTLSTGPLRNIEIPINNHDCCQVLIMTASSKSGKIYVNISCNNSTIMQIVMDDPYDELSDLINCDNINNNVHLLSIIGYF